MITNKYKIGFNVFIAIVLVFPLMVSSAGLVPCGGPAGDMYTDNQGNMQDASHPCGFDDIIIMANTIIHFIMYDVIVPLIAIAFMYVGGRLVLFTEKESEWSKAKESFKNIGIGIFIVLGSFLLIKFILFQFLNTDAGFTLFLLQ